MVAFQSALVIIIVITLLIINVASLNNQITKLSLRIDVLERRG